MPEYFGLHTRKYFFKNELHYGTLFLFFYHESRFNNSLFLKLHICATHLERLK